MQLNEAVDTGKSVQVQCPIIFVNGGRRCNGTVILDGQRWGVRGGKIYHRIIENYDEDRLGEREKEGTSGKEGGGRKNKIHK